MKIAYIILTHKNPNQLLRLIRKLDTDEASFFVHVDQKTKVAVYQEIVTNLSGTPNIYFLNRHKVHWGDFSQVAATIEGLKTLFSKDIAFDYVRLLSGQCYPLKSNMEIEETLQESKGKSFIEYFPLPHDKWLKGGEKNGGLDRVTYLYLQILDRRFRLPFKRTFPKGFRPFAGSAYWFLSKECAKFVYEFTNQNPSFVNFFRFVNLPDEIFFQTIILNSPLKEKIRLFSINCGK